MLLISSICLSIAVAQTDSALTFYPLQKGNRWQYQTATVGTLGYPSTLSHYYEVDVTGDTTLPNGNNYFVVECSENRVTHPRFQRIDSSTSQIIAFDTSGGGKEYVIDSLRAPARSAFSGCRLPPIPVTLMWSVDTVFYYGSQRIRRHYETVMIYGPYILYTLTQGFGLTAMETGVFDLDQNQVSITTDALVYANIGGKEFGTFVYVPPKAPITNSFELYQNYPNPFNPITTIDYMISTSCDVNLKVFDILGNEVATLVNEKEQAGVHSARFIGNNLSTGIYFYRLEAGMFTQTRKLMLLK
jgi:hypothetical protein